MTKTESRTQHIEYQRQMVCILDNILMETNGDDSELRSEIINLRHTLNTMSRYLSYCQINNI